MKHKILLTTAFIFALATTLTLAKFVFADATTPNLLPVADYNSSGWTPSVSGAPHYTMVDDVGNCNGDLDYNYAVPSTPDEHNYDHYLLNISSIPNGAVLNSITITPCASAHVLATSTPVTSTLYVGYGYENGPPPSWLASVNYYLQGTNNTPAPLAPFTFTTLIAGTVKGPNTQIDVWVGVNGKAGARVSQIIANISYSYTAAPTVGATSVVSTTPTSTGFYAYVNPNGTSTTGWFRYGSVSPGTCNDTFGTRVPAVGGINLGAGNSPVQYFYYNAPLSRDTIYYYCAIAENALGKSFGALKSFKTAP